MNERILNLKIEDLFLEITISEEPQEIAKMKVKDFIKKNSFSLKDVAKKTAEEYIKKALKALGEYNLSLEMTDLDEEIFKKNRNSVFLTNRLDKLFKSNVHTVLRKRGITTLSSLVTLTEEELAKKMHPSTLQAIKNSIKKLGLHLGMSNEEVLTLAEEEAKKDKKQLEEDIKNDRSNILRMPIEDFFDFLGFDMMRIPYGSPIVRRVHTVEDLIKLDSNSIKCIIGNYLKRKTFKYTDDKTFFRGDPECERCVHSYFVKIWYELSRYSLTINMDNTAIEIYKANPDSLLLKEIINFKDDIPDYWSVAAMINDTRYVYQLTNKGHIPQIREFLASRDIPITANGEVQLWQAKMKETKVLVEYAREEKKKKENNPNYILSMDINKFVNMQKICQESFWISVPELKLKHPTNPRKTMTTVKDLIALSDEELKIALSAAMNQKKIKDTIAKKLKGSIGASLTEETIIDTAIEKLKDKIATAIYMHHLRLGMTKAEIKIYSIKPDSILLNNINTYFGQETVQAIIHNTGKQITSIASLASTKKEDLNTLSLNTMKEIEYFLRFRGLNLGMTEAELAAYARRENTQAIVDEIKTTLANITALAGKARTAEQAEEILRQAKVFRSVVTYRKRKNK